jgi:glycosyltransferase involved in cell wall biosynthesis
MRIAMVTQSYPPMVSGAAIFVRRLTEALAKHGHSVLVLAASDTSNPSISNERNLTIVRMRSLHNSFRVNQRFTIWPYREMMKELYAFSPDVIHIHDPLQMGMISRVYSEEVGTPLIVTVHALPIFLTSYLQLPKEIKKGIERTLWKFASSQYSRVNGIVVATETIARIIREHLNIDPTIISCGIDLKKFFPMKVPPTTEKEMRDRFGIPMSAPIILHVGRLDKDKNVAQVLKGTQSLLQNTDAHLLAVGNGTEMQNLKTLSRKMGIQDKVHFPGYIVDETELADTYRIASIFVTASEIETQGIVLLEAAACGLPIVAPDCISIPELVHDQVNGFLYAPGDTRKLTDSVWRLCMDKKLAKSMRKANSEIIVQHAFTNTVKKYEELYQSCLQSTAT